MPRHAPPPPPAPLVALWSPPEGPERWPRLRARPRATYRFRGDPARSEWLGPARPAIQFTHDPLADLRALLAVSPPAPTGARPPQTGGWVGYLSYDLGRFLEPAAAGPRQPARDRDWPLIELHRCDSAAPAVNLLVGAPADQPPAVAAPDADPAPFESGAARVVEYIHAGDVFQVNLAHRLSVPFDGSPRRLFRALAGRARPWHGAYLEASDTGGRRRAILSLSPELFLQYDARTRTVTTRPMKGTRPGAADPGELDASPKERAELNMIIDLMRNDLGRVCRFGTVRVESARTIEPHGLAPGGRPSLWQATATITGELREGLDVCDLLAATFPPGSVTGAPKIRAMQIIDELEPVARGPYCGCIGWVGDDGSAAFSVAIRTALVTGEPGDVAGTVRGTLDYSVGAGIVADSNPASEWQETLDKAAILRGD